MFDIGSNESLLFFKGGVVLGRASPGSRLMSVVVTPLRKMVGKL